MAPALASVGTSTPKDILKLIDACTYEMATHSGVLAWRIPGTAEPGGLPSMGSHMTEAT